MRRWGLALAVGLACASAWAADAPRIAAIRVQGAHLIDAELVRARLGVRAGEPLDREALSQGLKRLYASGYVQDAELWLDRSARGAVLIVRIKENPVIGSVRFVGNEEFSDRTLKKRLKLKPGDVLSERLKRKVLARIRKGYFKKGYYQVQAEIRTKKRPDGRVDVVVAIDEGVQTRIKRIDLIGVRAFDREDVLKELISREEDLGAAITDRDVFARDKAMADVQRIETFYQNRGFLDARVEAVSARLTMDRSGFALAYAVEEGPRYRVGEIKLEGDLVPDAETLRQAITLERGAWYSLAELRASVEKLTETIGSYGYAYATVTPLFHRRTHEGFVDISFDIEKGPETYVDMIHIRGNEKTEDAVIRRELR
ncbi:MAG: outer membrane protein assembly factor BamA, partial [Zetaproteobacteria bacterium]